MAEIFISYAREDRETAERLATTLETHGWSVFWDRHIPTGQRFDEVLARKLDASRCVIVLWSNAANASQWVAEEAEEARERGVLLPALIEPVEPPLGFRRLHAADLVDWDGDTEHPGLRQLLSDVGKMLSGQDTSTSPEEAVTAPPVIPGPDRGRRWSVPVAWVLPALIAAAVLVLWQWGLFSKHLPQSAPAISPPLATATGTEIDGRWQGSVRYDWGVTIDETFNFRVLGGVLTGSAGFLGVARPIETASVSNDTIGFITRRGELAGGILVINRYRGEVQGDAINMVLTIEGGSSPSAPVVFTLQRLPR